MEYQEFMNRTQQASRLLNSGHLQETIDFLYTAARQEQVVEKANVCTNLATVYDRMGNTETAISWYDKGVDLEQNYSRFEVSEKKAQYLSQLGRNRDAVLIYETLIKQPFVSEADKERMRKITQNYLGQATRPWQ